MVNSAFLRPEKTQSVWYYTGIGQRDFCLSNTGDGFTKISDYFRLSIVLVNFFSFFFQNVAFLTFRPRRFRQKSPAPVRLKPPPPCRLFFMPFCKFWTRGISRRFRSFLVVFSPAPCEFFRRELSCPANVFGNFGPAAAIDSRVAFFKSAGCWRFILFHLLNSNNIV